jgi:hypothetical protein
LHQLAVFGPTDVLRAVVAHVSQSVHVRYCASMTVAQTSPMYPRGADASGGWIVGRNISI